MHNSCQLIAVNIRFLSKEQKKKKKKIDNLQYINPRKIGLSRSTLNDLEKEKLITCRLPLSLIIMMKKIRLSYHPFFLFVSEKKILPIDYIKLNAKKCL